MEYADGILYGCFSGYSLYCLYDDFLCLWVGVKFGFVHYLINIACSCCASFVFHAFNQSRFRFFCTQTGKFLQFLAFLLLHLLKIVSFDLEEFLFVVDTLLLLLNVLLAASHVLLSLVKFVFALLDFLVSWLDFFFKFCFFVQEFLLYLKHFLFFQNFRILLCGVHQFFVFSIYYVTENKISA